jgi:hypothetical protein
MQDSNKLLKQDKLHKGLYNANMNILDTAYTTSDAPLSLRDGRRARGKKLLLIKDNLFIIIKVYLLILNHLTMPPLKIKLTKYKILSSLSK